MSHNYFLVDGSSLLAEIKSLRRVRPELAGRFDVVKMVRYFTDHNFHQFLEGGYRRFTFYFVKNDERIKTEMLFPRSHVPGEFEDLRIEYCGKRIGEYAKAQEWLEKKKAPLSVRECCYRSEKAVDTQICCDALQLAALNKLDRVFLYSNDYDFIPLCKTLRSLGVNVNLIRLSADKVNKDLVNECDAFSIMDTQSLSQCFAILQPQA